MQSENAVLSSRQYQVPNTLGDRTQTFGLPLEEALRRRSIELEIGCGVGWHPIEVAKLLENDQALIAIERTSNKFAAFQRRLQNHPHLQDVLSAVHADAFHFIATSVPSASLDKIWMLYPNPEIKRPNNRWYLSPGFRRALQALRIGGVFHFATNIADYAHAGEAQAKSLGLSLQEARLIQKSQLNQQSNQAPFSPRTHFEKKYYERGETLFDYVFQKTSEVS